MGNQKSFEMKSKYERGHYRVFRPNFDSNLGNYQLIMFTDNNNLFIQQDLNPGQYNEDIESTSFQSKIVRECKHISDFYFVTYADKFQKSYKMIYEYGKPIRKQIIKEKTIWKIIRQVIKAGVFLEDCCLHYPLLEKQYLLEKDGRYFKLLNPFCFPGFLKEVIQVYMSPKIEISRKKEYSKQSIRKNTFQFPFFIIGLITGESQNLLMRDLSHLQNNVNALINKPFSPAFLEFIYYLLQEKPVSFFEIEKYLKSLQIDFRNPSMTRRYRERNLLLQREVLFQPKMNLDTILYAPIDSFSLDNNSNQFMKINIKNEILREEVNSNH